MLESFPNKEAMATRSVRERITFNGEFINTHFHPSSIDGPLTIIYPGFNGEIDGYSQKYLKIATMISGTVGPVLQADNQFDNKNYSDLAKARLARIIQYGKDVMEQRGKKPDVYLAGFSAGAAAVAAIAGTDPRIKKILIIAPSRDVSPEDVAISLDQFIGETYIAVGDADEVVGTKYSETLAKRAQNAKLFIAPDADHQFRGTEQGKLMSSLFKWSFEENHPDPNPNNGIVLY
jgi:pimeloyl-ACP methyl ester carboxylesterase